jgi:hypothetical protein
MGWKYIDDGSRLMGFWSLWPVGISSLEAGSCVYDEGLDD